MAFDAFLKIDGIDGESADQFHKGEIQLLSFSWGVTNAGELAPGAGTGRGGGRPPIPTFHVVKHVDSASPKLFDKMVTGGAIKEVSLTARHPSNPDANAATGATVDYFLKITLDEVLISSVQSGGNTQSDENPTESVALNFAKIEYAVAGPNGKFVTAEAAGFLKI